MNNKYYCVIMAGGHNNHFWPITRNNKPNQFLDITGTGKSLLRKAYERCLDVVPKENILIVTIKRFKDLVLKQVPDIPKENLLLEPFGRRTAPCIAYATYTLLKRSPDAVMAITPADLVISDEDLFKESLSNALDYATNYPVLMTLGVKPNRPDPNFGYIQATGGKAAINGHDPVKVKTFTEKPDAELAEVFYKSGEFFWNSGIFVWQASVIREEMDRYIPEVTNLFTGWEGALGSPSESAFLDRAYADCTKISIDYGVMEKTTRAWLYPVQFGWSDIDNWDSVYASLPHKDKDGNITNTDKCYLKDDMSCVMVSGNKKKLIAVKGLEDFLVIDTDDVLLICPKDDKEYKDFVMGTMSSDYEEYR